MTFLVVGANCKKNRSRRGDDANEQERGKGGRGVRKQVCADEITAPARLVC